MPTVRTPTDDGKPGLQQEKIDGGLPGKKHRDAKGGKARRYEALATVSSAARALAAKLPVAEKPAACWAASLLASSRLRQGVSVAAPVQREAWLVERLRGGWRGPA